MTISVDDDTLRAHVQEWQQRQDDKNLSTDQVKEYYEKFVFPGVFERFLATALVHRHMYRGLVILGSFQPDTAALLIAALDPERVAFLLTNETHLFQEKVQQRLSGLGVLATLRCSPDQWLPPKNAGWVKSTGDMYGGLPSDHSTVLHTYRGVRAVIEAWHDLAPDQIAIDVTGGKATMTVGLAKSAHVLGLHSLYVESQYDNRNRVVQGSQRLSITEDPIVVFGDLELAEAQRLAKRHEYAAAHKVLSDLTTRKQLPAQHKFRYTMLARLARVYAAWDAFAFDQAQQEMSVLLSELQTVPELKITSQHDVLSGQYEVLCLLNKASTAVQTVPFETLRDNLPTTLALLGSFYSGAVRRATRPAAELIDDADALRRRYDFASLLLYRCLELMSQRRLAVRGVDFDDKRITLMQGYKKLQGAGDGIIFTNLVDRIATTNAARNKSILAHGFRLIRYEEYCDFHALVKDVLERFLEIEGQSALDEWQKTFMFVALE